MESRALTLSTPASSCCCFASKYQVGAMAAMSRVWSAEGIILNKTSELITDLRPGSWKEGIDPETNMTSIHVTMERMICMPAVIIIGAQKGGSTVLFTYVCVCVLSWWTWAWLTPLHLVLCCVVLATAGTLACTPTSTQHW